MKPLKLSKFAVFALLSVALLAGCERKTQPATPTYDHPAATEQAPAAVTPANSVSYYSQHLEEAQKTWHECLAKGPNGMDETQRATCSNAHSAWEMQPYKAKK